MNHSAMLAALGTALVLPACNQNNSVQQAPAPPAALPLSTASAPPIVAGPAGDQLPPAPPARLATVNDPGDSYGWLDQASSEDEGFGDAPPDYTFDYDGYQPWVWRSGDGYYQVVEPLADGYRYYFYRPGSDYPYLVRGPDYSYGYDNGALVTVYDRAGHVLPESEVSQRAGLAGRYLARARDLYDASSHARHQPVAAANWSARAPQLASVRQQWTQQRTADPQWSQYHDQHAAQTQAQWSQERYVRESEAARTAQTLHDPAAAATYAKAAEQAKSDAHAHAHGQAAPAGQGGGDHAGAPTAVAGRPANAPEARPGEAGGPARAADSRPAAREPGASPGLARPSERPGAKPVAESPAREASRPAEPAREARPAAAAHEAPPTHRAEPAPTREAAPVRRAEPAPAHEAAPAARREAPAAHAPSAKPQARPEEHQRPDAH